MLDIEVPDRYALSNEDKAALVQTAKRRYRALLKIAHPDKCGEKGFGAACKRTTALCEAFQFVQTFLNRRPITITERFDRYYEKKRQGFYDEQILKANERYNERRRRKTAERKRKTGKSPIASPP